jgi:hypothetical protein
VEQQSNGGTSNWPDYYTAARNHITRVETALSNTAARLWDAIEKALDPHDRPKDRVAEQVVVAANAIQDIQKQAVASWQKGEFQKLSLGKRLKTGAEWLGAADVALSRAEIDIQRLSPHPSSASLQVLRAIAAQQTRIDGVLKEHHDRERAERPTTVPDGRREFEASEAVPPVRPFPAQVQSGAYRGAVIEVTDSLVVQQISSRMSVVHQRGLLNCIPAVGENASIRYSNGAAIVNALKESARGNELDR